MQVELKDLHKGDEVLTAVGGDLIRIKLLRDPQLKKVQPNYRQVGKQYYKSIKCSFRKDQFTYQWVGHLGNVNTRYGFEYTLDDMPSNGERYFDLNYKNIWLIKKNN